MNPASVELIDIGTGTGALTAELSQRIVDWGLAAKLAPRLRIWLIDFASASAASLFRLAPLGRHVQSLMGVSMDYRKWLASPRRLPAASGVRIALALKVFDMASHFSIGQVSTNVLSSIADPRGLAHERYLPERCLSRSGEGSSALQVSSSRISVPEGHVFPLASLSPFFRGLRMASHFESDNVDDGGLSLPVRSFNSQALVTDDGASVIARLTDQCDYTIVEDADLRPQDLVAHLCDHSLREVAAVDMTKAMQLKANYAYVLWRKDRKDPGLEGERIC